MPKQEQRAGLASHSTAALAPPPRVPFYNNPKIRALFYQLVLLVAVMWAGYEFALNARANLAAQNITGGFGFLDNSAGFGVNQALIPYNESDTYARVFFVGLLTRARDPWRARA